MYCTVTTVLVMTSCFGNGRGLLRTDYLHKDIVRIRTSRRFLGLKLSPDLAIRGRDAVPCVFPRLARYVFTWYSPPPCQSVQCSALLVPYIHRQSSPLLITISIRLALRVCHCVLPLWKDLSSTKEDMPEGWRCQDDIHGLVSAQGSRPCSSEPRAGAWFAFY